MGQRRGGRLCHLRASKGKPLAAYLYLPRETGTRAARTEDGGRGLRVDYDAGGKPIGLELTAPSLLTLADVNAVLGRIGVPELGAEDWAPLCRA